MTIPIYLLQVVANSVGARAHEGDYIVEFGDGTSRVATVGEIASAQALVDQEASDSSTRAANAASARAAHDALGTDRANMQTIRDAGPATLLELQAQVKAIAAAVQRLDTVVQALIRSQWAR